MKRLLTLTLVSLLLVAPLAFASEIDWSAYTRDELVTMQQEIADALLALDGEAPAGGGVVYETLKTGSRGDDVLKLKNRLYELGYFKNNEFNNQYNDYTGETIKEFQRASGLTPSGIADQQTLEALYSDSASVKPGATPDPKKAYGKLNYDALARYPEEHLGEKIKFDGRVLQALGSRSEGYELRVATKGRYDNIIYLFVADDPGFGILEDDKLTIYGTAYSTISYTSVMGAEVTLPAVVADELILK